MLSVVIICLDHYSDCALKKLQGVPRTNLSLKQDWKLVAEALNGQGNGSIFCVLILCLNFHLKKEIP